MSTKSSRVTKTSAPAPVTASGLTKAQLIAEEAGVKLTVHFNPKEISIEKQVKWEQKAGTITDEPPEEFQKPTPATLSVTLHFDTYEDKSPVTEATDEMMKCARIISSSIKRPPLCRFVWGKTVFKGVVESLTIKYTMFLSSGTPVRAECTLKMKAADQSVTGSGSGGGGGGGGGAT